MTSETTVSFDQLALSAPVLKMLDEVGYETPSPIQAQTIPLIAAGRDLVGQAQTGTGKTAAFALPILSSLQLQQKNPQVLVLAPTRELAIQVAEAFQKYAHYLKGFHVLPIYGGQDYRGQIRALNRGVHVVVGTPGRVMDHMRRGTLKLQELRTLVLDEADEMLRMGFIEDVEWILEQLPRQRQIVLFSATMPEQIRAISKRYLRDPEQVTIKLKTATAETIRQRFWTVQGVHKLDALTRILEAEVFDGMIVFVRTKTATVELADRLQARGHAAAALNGDIAQNQRERTVQQLKDGKLDILVATDVAARGLDVERITHVINYDIPYDTEAYIHRIGRTGRAGRKGEAILFVAPREKRLLRSIEKATRKKIELMQLPTAGDINARRIRQFNQQIEEVLENEDLEFYEQLVSEYQEAHSIGAARLAAALACMSRGDTPLLSPEAIEKAEKRGRERNQRGKPPGHDEGGARGRHGSRKSRAPEKGMQRYRIEVGHAHGTRPGNIVGAIANEAGIESQYIGSIDIHDNFSLVDLPEGMPKDIFNTLKNVRVSGQKLRISRAGASTQRPGGARKGGGKGAQARAPENRKPKKKAHRKGRKPG